MSQPSDREEVQPEVVDVDPATAPHAEPPADDVPPDDDGDRDSWNIGSAARARWHLRPDRGDVARRRRTGLRTAGQSRRSSRLRACLCAAHDAALGR